MCRRKPVPGVGVWLARTVSEPYWKTVKGIGFSFAKISV